MYLFSNKEMKIIQWDEIVSESGRGIQGARVREKQTTFIFDISFLRNKILKNKAAIPAYNNMKESRVEAVLKNKNQCIRASLL